MTADSHGHEAVDPSDTLAVLKAAEAWLSDPEHWTTGSYWCLEDGRVTATCVNGAFAYVCWPDSPAQAVVEERDGFYGPTRSAVEAFADALGVHPTETEEANDDGGYEVVMSGLRKAIGSIEPDPAYRNLRGETVADGDAWTP